MGGLNAAGDRLRARRELDEARAELARALREQQEVEERIQAGGDNGLMQLKRKRCQLFRATCERDVARCEAVLNELLKNQ